MPQESASDQIEVFELNPTSYRTIREERNLEGLLDNLCKTMTEWADIQSGWLVLINRQQKADRFVRWSGGRLDDPGTSPPVLGFSPKCLRRVLELGEAFSITNREAFCGECPLFSGPGIGKAILLPLRYRDTLLGVLCLCPSQVLVPDMYFKNFLNLLIEDASSALWLMQLQDENRSIGRMHSRKMKSRKDGVIILNDEGNILFFNQSAEDFFYVKAEDVLGKSLIVLQNSFLYQKWLVSKGSLENVYTYVVPEVKIEKGGIRYFKVYISRTNTFSKRNTLYYISLEETFRLEGGDDPPPARLSSGKKGYYDFADIMDLEVMGRIQRFFSDITGLASTVVTPDGGSILSPTNMSDYCSLIRNSEQGCMNCIRSDSELAGALSGDRSCKCGSGRLWDTRFPIVVDGRHIATWLIGQARDPEQDRAFVKEYAGEIGVNPEELLSAYMALPAMTREDFNQRVSFLNTVTSQMVTIAYHHLKQLSLAEERRNFTELLQKREEYFQGVLKIAPVGIVVVNDRFQLIQVNDRVCSVSGYSQEELINRDSSELFMDMNEYRRVIHLEKEQIESKGYSRVEAVCRHKTGELFHVILRTVRADHNDRTKGYVIGIQDITEEKVNENKRDILSSAVENSSDCVFITDRKGEIIFVNSSFEKLTGYAFQEVCGRIPDFLNSTQRDSPLYRDLMRTIRAGDIWRDRLNIRKKDGSSFTGDTLFTPVKSRKGEITNFVCATRDLTDQIRVEEDNRLLEEQFYQTQKEESIGKLAGGIAHDLNNILTPILGYSELMIDESDPDKTRQNRILQIYEGGERARKMVKQLLTFSRKQVLDFQLMDLNGVITDFVPLLRRTLRENIQLDLELNPSLPGMEGDSGKIEQVLMNLAINAQDAMAGGGVLTIGTDVKGPPESPKVVLSFRDQGCGIGEENLDQIFEPFFSTKGDKGTGLGLANVQRIVKQHKGRIDVRSGMNRGTEFLIEIPAAVRNSEGGISPDTQSSIREGRSGCTVLLVEDDDYVREVAQSMLIRQGMHVLSADCGEKAVALIQEGTDPIQILLSDVVMPGMNGFELHRHFKQSFPRGRTLFMSGYLEISGEKEYESLEDADFIQKPLSLNELVKKIMIMTGRDKPVASAERM